MTELTVILTAHNRADLVEEMLASLAEQEWGGDWDIVLVDNDSTDATPEILERWADKMPVPTQVVTATEHHNLCYSRAAGVAVSDGEAIAFLDDDDMIAPGYVAAIADALRDHPFVGPRHDHTLLNDEVSAAYRGGFQTTELGTAFGVEMVSGGGFSCRRQLWDDLGGQRAEIGYGAEDIDFALRAADRGARPGFVPDAVYHVRLRTGARTSFRQGRQFGAARAMIHALHGQAAGSRPESVGRVLRRWAGLAFRLPNLRHEGPRLVWLWQLGRQIGQLQGSLTHRTWYP